MGGACSSQPVNPVPQDDAPPPPAPDANDGANAATSSDAAADAGVVTADEQAFLDAEAAGIDVQSEDVLDEDVFSDEEAEFGEVEEDNKDGVDDTEALTFGVQDVEGENFMAVKPWIGAIKEPSDWSPPDDLGRMPDKKLQLSRVYGYRCRSVYSNVHVAASGEVVYPAAAIVVMLNTATGQQRFYQGHVDDVLSLALDPTRTLAASGGKATISDAGRSVHPSVHIWDVATGETKAIIRNQHKRAVPCVAFSPDSLHVASVGMDNDHYLKIHEVATGNTVASVKTGTDKVIDIAWNASTGYITTVGVKHVCFWRFTGRGFERCKKGLVGRLGKRQTNLGVAFAPDGRTWTGTYSGRVYVWHGNRLVKSLKGHSGRVNAVASGPMGMLSGDSKGNIKFWDAKGNCLGGTKVTGQVRAIGTSPDGRVVVGTSKGEVLELTFNAGNPEATTATSLVQGHFAGETWALACDKDGTRAVTGGDDNLICLWDLTSHTRLAHRIIEEKAVAAKSRHGQRSTMSSCAPNQCCRSADWGPAGTVAIGTNAGKVMVLDSRTLNTICEAQITERPISVVKFDPTGDYLAVGAHDSIAYIVKTEDLSVVAKCKGNSSYISQIDWDSSGIAIQTCSGAYELLFYNATSGEQETSGATLFRDEPWASFTSVLGWPVQGIWPAFAKGSDINTVDRSTDSTLLAVGDDRGRIRLFRYPCLDRGSACRVDRGHASHLTKLRFTADTGRLLSLGGNDNALLEWSVVPCAAE